MINLPNIVMREIKIEFQSLRQLMSKASNKVASRKKKSSKVEEEHKKSQRSNENNKQINT